MAGDVNADDELTLLALFRNVVAFADSQDGAVVFIAFIQYYRYKRQGAALNS